MIAAMLSADGCREIGPLRPEPSRVPVLQAFEQERLANFERPEKCFASDVPACYRIFGLLYEAHSILRARAWPSPRHLMALGPQSSGSAVHKLPSMFDNLREPMPGRSLVVFDLNIPFAVERRFQAASESPSPGGTPCVNAPNNRPTSVYAAGSAEGIGSG
jgi:hypothetical protein